MKNYEEAAREWGRKGVDLEMGVLKLKREMSPRCMASQTLETHKKQLRPARYSRDLQ